MSQFSILFWAHLTWPQYHLPFLRRNLFWCFSSYHFFFSDIAKVSANGTIIPEHNMSLHPYFNFDVQRNVTARVGQTAFLQCKVEQLGDKSVRIFPHSFNRNRMEAVSRCWHLYVISGKETFNLFLGNLNAHCTYGQ